VERDSRPFRRGHWGLGPPLWHQFPSLRGGTQGCGWVAELRTGGPIWPTPVRAIPCVSADFAGLGVLPTELISRGSPVRSGAPPPMFPATYDSPAPPRPAQIAPGLRIPLSDLSHPTCRPIPGSRLETGDRTDLPLIAESLLIHRSYEQIHPLLYIVPVLAEPLIKQAFEEFHSQARRLLVHVDSTTYSHGGALCEMDW
jgi:hypothetical protein